MKKIKVPNLKKIKENKKGKTKRKINKSKVWKVILVLFLIGCIMVLIAVGLFFGYIVKNAPNFNPDELYDAEPTVYYDKNGNEIAKLGNKIRSVVKYDDLPESLVDALVATEDSRYFQHNGFDLPRFLKASALQATGHSQAGGASTLTMQLSKNKITVKEKEGFKGLSNMNIVRKFTDIYMAVFKIEKYYTKEEIIEFYVNSNYLGANTNGVEDASQVYFGKSVSDLSIAESAMIAGLFNAPGYYDPYKNPEGCEQRRQTVLYLLKRHGYITDEEYEIAKGVTVEKMIKPQANTDANPYQDFIDMVTNDVIKATGNDPYTIPMKVYTTMDSDKQRYVYDTMEGNNPNYAWENDTVQAGVAVIDAHDGSISAIGGGRHRVVRGLNRAIDIEDGGIRRQIGSTAKPLYDYGLGIEVDNWSTGKIFVDEPWGYTGGDEISNWDKKFVGFVNMRDALVDSRNIPALKAFQMVGNQKRVEWIKSLGLHPEMDDGFIHEAHSIGGYVGESPLSLAGAYNAFATGGYYIKPYSFTKVEYNDGTEPYEYKYTMDRVMSPETAWMMTNVLVSVMNGSGFGKYYVNGVSYAAKSGTTNLSKADLQAWGLNSKAVADLWAVGYTDKYTIATWYGYDSLEEGHNTFGSGQNYRIFTAIARGVFTEQSNFPRPAGVVTAKTELGCYEACLATEYTPANLINEEYYKKGYEPTVVSDRFAKLPTPTNLKASVKDNKIELKWDAIPTPNSLNMDYLNQYFMDAYEHDDWGTNAALQRYNENTEILGSVIYNVYEEVNGELKLYKKTSDNFMTVKPTRQNPTYVVKASYSLYEPPISDGVSIKVNGVSVFDLITATQNIKEASVKELDSKIPNENKIATVTVNGVAAQSNKVTYQYTLDKSKVPGQKYDLSVKVLYDGDEVDTFTIKITVTQ